MRRLLMLLLLAGIALAATVPADVRAIKNTGNENLPKMNVGITIDCATKALFVQAASNSTGESVVSAQTFLFYTDYEYQLVGTGSTNSSGVSKINVIGNPDYLTALFILRVDKSGYQSRETEFTYKYCFQSPPPDIGTGYGDNEEPPEEPPELKKLDIEVRPACSAGGTLNGQLVSVTSEGAPVSGAFVNVEDISPAKKITSGETNTSGQFIFAGCGGDEFSIRASKGGYESREITHNLSACDACPKPPAPPAAPPANGSQPPDGGNATKPGTGNGGPSPAAPSACPLGLLFLSALVLRSRL